MAGMAVSRGKEGTCEPCELCAPEEADYLILAKNHAVAPVALSDGIYIIESFGALNVSVQSEVLAVLLEGGAWSHLGHLDIAPVSSFLGLQERVFSGGQYKPLPFSGTEFVITLRVGKEVCQGPTVYPAEWTGNGL